MLRVRTLVVSDVHLGAPGRLPEADGELCSLLRQDWREVIFLGDLFDLWAAPFQEIAARHPTVLGVIDTLRCRRIFVPGNHDGAFRSLRRLNSLEVVPFYILNSGAVRFCLMHGDECDPLTPLSRTAAYLFTVADRIAQAFAGPGVSVHRTVRHSLAASGASAHYSEEIAKCVVKQAEADAYVIGHTHIPEHPRWVGSKMYANSGDFGPEHMTYAVIDDGVVQICGMKEAR